MLKGKKILIGITASVAAYKAIYLVRLLVKAGADVKVVMTPAAKDFVRASEDLAQPIWWRSSSLLSQAA